VKLSIWHLIKTLKKTFYGLFIMPLFEYARRVVDLYRIGPALDIKGSQQSLLKRVKLAFYTLDSSTLDLVVLDEAVAEILDISFEHEGERSSNRNLKTWLNPIDKQRIVTCFEQVGEGGEYELKYRITTFKDQMKWVLDKGVKKKSQNQVLCIGVWKDITEFELIKQSLDFLSRKDPLTGLLNRFAFNDEFEQWVEQQRDKKNYFALLRLQIDNYEHLKDTLGVENIDQFERLYALKLKEIMDSSAILSRQGVGLYCALLPLTDVDDEMTVINYCTLIQRHSLSPMAIKQLSLKVSASVGISLSPKYAEESHLLTRQADMALQKVIENGGNHYAFFSEEMNERVRFKTMVENELLEAIEAKQLYLEFQPQVDMSAGQILGAEALVRWRHPVHGFIAPIDFIDIAETTGLIRELGMWVFSQACKVRSSWAGQLPSDVVMAVNVSPIQLDERFVDFVHRTLRQYQLPPKCIEIEVTENHLMENFKDRISNLKALSKMGIPLAIDDFGTGYSSLSCLRQLPLQKIKIDRSFVKDITDIEHSDGNAIIKAILAIGSSLNMKVLAEGVEVEFQEQYLKAQGCDAYQGYYFSPPVSSIGMIKLYNEQAAKREEDGLHASQ
jgi:diguanylate cyclase (GGDEF)-like protein